MTEIQKQRVQVACAGNDTAAGAAAGNCTAAETQHIHHEYVELVYNVWRQQVAVNLDG